MDIIYGETGVVVEISTTAAANTEIVDEKIENEEEEAIMITDEAPPLYANGSTQVSYGVYGCIIIFGIALITYGMYLFQKKHN